jgi:hypothetical protein
MRLWQLRGCRYRKFQTAGVKRAMTGRAMLHEITFPLEAYAEGEPPPNGGALTN